MQNPTSQQFDEILKDPDSAAGILGKDGVELFKRAIQDNQFKFESLRGNNIRNINDEKDRAFLESNPSLDRESLSPTEVRKLRENNDMVKTVDKVNENWIRNDQTSGNITAIPNTIYITRQGDNIANQPNIA